ncbi:MAG TPA: serine hydrolase [Nocardioides sp.]|nr:serine hydrolase [Nocardioides sp.]
MTTPTVADWQSPAMVRTSFQRIDSFLPTAPISRGDGAVATWPVAPAPLADLLVAPELGTVADVVAATETDAWMVVHDGRVLAEEYVAPMTPATRHLLMSVSKSVVGVTAGALVDRGLLDPERQVTSYLPELENSGYAGATVRDVLDMRTGVRFSEDYLDPTSEVRRLDESVGWAPHVSGGPATLHAFLATLVAERPHGGPFHYRSCETDVLGWICEAAGQAPLADLVSDLVWSRLGAEHDAFLCVDSEGSAMCDGGINTTLRDLARFGATVLGAGVAPTGERVVSQAWIDDLFAGSPELVAAFAAGPEAAYLPGGHYRSQLWVPPGGERALCLGIHGQLVYVDRAARLVGVKLSSWPLPEDDARMSSTLRMFEAIGRLLAGASGLIVRRAVARPG